MICKVLQNNVAAGSDVLICCLFVVSSSVQIIFSVMCIFMYIQEWRKNQG